MGKRKRRSSGEHRKQLLLSNLVQIEEDAENMRNRTVFLSLLLMLIGMSVELFTYLCAKVKLQFKNSECARKVSTNRPRPTWEAENQRISDRNFYRLFRMTRPCFKKLCNRIEKAIGEEEFKSESYLNRLKSQGRSTRQSSMYIAACNGGRPWIAGEVKVAMTLRMMAGVSYLHLFLWMNVEPDHSRSIFRHVTRYWICNDDVISINFFDVIKNDKELLKISSTFGKRSQNIFSGTVGALDGWLVKIRCPTLRECNNPGKYFCRKGFSAINVQVIVDLQKRVLWRKIGEKGSAHDSPVFHESSLGQFLEYWASKFEERGLYLIGDSAYALRSYLLTPYDNAKPGSTEDTFNFFLSSQRIYVECAFGEIDRRWGIFWKPLQGSLVNHKYVIDAGLRLHNFIVDFRNEKGDLATAEEEALDRDELDSASDDYQRENPFETMGAFTAAEMQNFKRRGRLPNKEKELREKGRSLRDEIRDKLARKGLSRPKKKKGTATRDRFNRTIVL